MADDYPETCGQGLAASAQLPARLAELVDALAGVLDSHTAALDPADPAAAAELAAYTGLVEAQRRIAGELAALGQRMAACHDLPVAAHDLAVLADPAGQAAAFARFLAAERELLALLHASLEQDAALHEADPPGDPAP